ncbi:MAG: class I SAM-dependent methyltransferase [bacterium]
MTQLINGGEENSAGFKVYEIPTIQGGILLEHRDGVWDPYSAGYFLNILQENRVFDRLQGTSLLDMGSGSGILGIAGLKRGARFVTMSDLSADAVALSSRNASLNGYQEGDHFEAVQSDAFVNISGRYNYIISNPPVQPELPVHQDHPAYKTNESGRNGRMVLDRLITEGRNHLQPQGQMIISSSSRHGHRLTIEMMDDNWGQGNWGVINSDVYGIGKEEQIITEYHGPYMAFWIGSQMQDMDFRVYQKDEQGLPICEASSPDGHIVKLVTVPFPEGNKTVKLDIVSGQVLRAVEWVERSEKEVKLPDGFVVPNTDTDKNWYYKYYILEANNAQVETNSTKIVEV